MARHPMGTGSETGASARSRGRSASRWRWRLGWGGAFLWALAAGCLGSPTPAAATPPGLSYTNQRVAKVPWSIHVVSFERTNRTLELRSVHAGGAAVGLAPLTAQLPSASAGAAPALAAINGDFYQRDRAYAGDPRGLQIVEGEVFSGPNGGVSFWTDARGEPHATNVASRFEVAWPDGRRSTFGLNCDRPPDGLVLYTPAIGPTTRTAGGRELVLEPVEGLPLVPLVPLRIGVTARARVREVRDAGDSPIPPGTLVLSLGPALARQSTPLSPGSELQLRIASTPDLAGARTAISGGPLLVQAGRRQKIVAVGESYEASSMVERHPRSAIGWNGRRFFLVLVDGRQKDLSVGMTLEELGTLLVQLGCEEAMNLDGGGSATLWYDGRIANRPCDGRERPIANALMVVGRGATEPVP